MMNWESVEKVVNEALEEAKLRLEQSNKNGVEQLYQEYCKTVREKNRSELANMALFVKALGVGENTLGNEKVNARVAKDLLKYVVYQKYGESHVTDTQMMVDSVMEAIHTWKEWYGNDLGKEVYLNKMDKILIGVGEGMISNDTISKIKREVEEKLREEMIQQLVEENRRLREELESLREAARNGEVALEAEILDEDEDEDEDLNEQRARLVQLLSKRYERAKYEEAKRLLKDIYGYEGGDEYVDKAFKKVVDDYTSKGLEIYDMVAHDTIILAELMRVMDSDKSKGMSDEDLYLEALVNAVEKWNIEERLDPENGRETFDGAYLQTETMKDFFRDYIGREPQASVGQSAHAQQKATSVQSPSQTQTASTQSRSSQKATTAPKAPPSATAASKTPQAQTASSTTQSTSSQAATTTSKTSQTTGSSTLRTKIGRGVKRVAAWMAAAAAAIGIVVAGYYYVPKAVDWVRKSVPVVTKVEKDNSKKADEVIDENYVDICGNASVEPNLVNTCEESAGNYVFPTVKEEKIEPEVLCGNASVLPESVLSCNEDIMDMEIYGPAEKKEVRSKMTPLARKKVNEIKRIAKEVKKKPFEDLLKQYDMALNNFDYRGAIEAQKQIAVKVAGGRTNLSKWRLANSVKVENIGLGENEEVLVEKFNVNPKGSGESRNDKVADVEKKARKPSVRPKNVRTNTPGNKPPQNVAQPRK